MYQQRQDVAKRTPAGIMDTNSKYHLPFIADAGLVQSALQEYLDDLSDAFTPQDRLIANLQVPGVDEFRSARLQNKSVLATLKIGFQDHPDVVDLRIPFPCNGVFVMRSGMDGADEEDRASLKYWMLRLGEAPGFSVQEFIRAENGGASEEIGEADEEAGEDAGTGIGENADIEGASEDVEPSVEAFLGDSEEVPRAPEPCWRIRIRPCCSASGLNALLNYKKDEDGGDVSTGTPGTSAKKKKPWCVLMPRRRIIDQIKSISKCAPSTFDKLLEFFSDASSVLLDREGAANLRAKMYTAAESLRGAPGTFKAMDSKDLAFMRVETYASFVVENVAQLVGHQLLLLSKTSAGVDCRPKLDGKKINRDMMSRFSEKSYEQNTSIVSRFDILDPLNALKVVSQLTAVKRHSGPRPKPKAKAKPKAKDKPKAKVNSSYAVKASDRQNHPSFAGYICPVETPESEQIGMTLHLAAGVVTAVDGTMRKTDQEGGLGYAAGLLPFFQHNDGVRSMMGAKNCVQALPIMQASPPMIRTGNEQVLRSLADMLCTDGLIDKASSLDAWCAPGRDVLVAYMPWYGLNYEDAIVASEALVEKFSFRQTLRHARYVPAGFILGAEGDEGSHEFNLEAQLNRNVAAYEIIAKYSSENKRFSIKADDDGQLISIKYHEPPSSLVGGLLEWEIKVEHKLSVGDKLMGRHGNKGVVSRLLPIKEMPRLPKDPRLGKLSGRYVDMLLNPHGVVSRMNIGQLMETQISLMKKLDMLDVKDVENIGKPFAQVDLDMMKAKIEEFCKRLLPDVDVMDTTGKVYLRIPDGTNPDGIRTRTPVAIGFQHMFRLNHIPSKKASLRTWDGLFRFYPADEEQDREDSRRGQRFGEMDIWALSAYNVPSVLADVVTDRIDRMDDKPDPGCSQSFETIKDLLFLRGIKLDSADGTYSMRLVNDDDVIRESEGREVAHVVGSMMGCEGTYACAKANCDYVLAEPVFATRDSQRSESNSLCVNDILRHHGMYLDDCPDIRIFEIPRDDSPIELTLKCRDSSSTECTVVFEARRQSRSIHITFSIIGCSYHAWRQYDSKSLDVPVGEILEMKITCCKEHGTTPLTLANNAQPVSSQKATRLHGIYDSRNYDRMGYIKLPAPCQMVPPAKKTKKASGNTNPGLTLLPVKIRSIAYKREKEALRERSRLAPFDRLQDCYEELVGDIITVRDGEKPEDILKEGYENLQKSLDLMLFGKRGRIRQTCTGRKIDISGRYVIVPDPELAWDEFSLPFDAILALCKDSITEWFYNDNVQALRDRAKDEKIILRDFLDYLHAVLYLCNLKYRPSSNSVGATARDRETFGEYSLKVLSCDRRVGHIPSIVVNENRKTSHVKPSKYVKELLISFLEHSEQLILVCRQPTLHRYNLKALRLKVSSCTFSKTYRGGLVDDGDDPLDDESSVSDSVMYVNPLICSSMAADFDGDTFALYLVAQPEDAWRHKSSWAERHGQSDCEEDPKISIQNDFLKSLRQMLPSAPGNLSSDADGSPTASFSMDIVLGTFLISRDKQKRTQFLEKCRSYGLETCTNLLPENKDWNKQVGSAFLRNICHIPDCQDAVAGFISEWMRMAFKAATEHGVSFGIFDILACQTRPDLASLEELKEKLGAISLSLYSNPDAKKETSAGKKMNEELDGQALGKLKEIIASPEPENLPGYGLAAIVASGAKGDKQIRQLLTARGFLAPGDIKFDEPASSFIFSESLLAGMSPTSAFWAAMNTRSTMTDKKLNVGDAGMMLKSLVFACWPWRITAKDCGSVADQRDPSTCLLNTSKTRDKRICARCYGTLENGELPGEDYPAGLIAAQVIGERCSQLSMQSFHASASAIDLNVIKDVFRLKTREDNKSVTIDNCAAFVNAMVAKDESPYKVFHKRHMQLLWRVIRESSGGSLASAVKDNYTKDPFLALIQSGRQKDFVFDAARTGVGADANSDWARAALGRSVKLQLGSWL